MAMLIVDGIELPNPTAYKVKLSDLDSNKTGRTEAGFMQRKRVRVGVYRIDVTWQVRKTAYKTITDALTPARFTVQFFDPNSNTVKAAQMYAADRDGSLLSYTNQSKPQDALWELSCALIEY